MRYSRLAYLAKMCRTLLEAAEYLDCAEKDAPARAELLQNGRVMLGQLQTELTRHREDLRSDRPLEYLTAVERAWETGGKERSEALEKLIECLPEDVHYQVRAVFFTGLGSTWDAMESVWAAMRDDPRFDPVVVLIPILRQHERNGKTEEEVLYEDYLTPMGVPFREYTQYSLEEDCPDLAFTNQPYEGSLRMDYWPEIIAGKTRLVYLPYYLSNVVEGMTRKALCEEPIHRCAWRVICSTEKEYRYYCRCAANGGANGLLAGLPKLDHLAGLRERGVPLPPGWECLEGKKVFLWNSWYIMNHSSLMKFEEIFRWFAEHLDCALIWRPHPMTETVTKLHYPKDYQNYLEYVRRVREAPNMLLDQGISYEAAFYYSHALISDYSSLLPQYLLMDRPALWMKAGAEVWRFTGEEFIDSGWMEQTEELSETLEFLEQIRRGEDRKAELRQTIRARDMAWADGHAGERLCGVLWQELQKEDFGIW
ncbi:MAG: hypothetical protein HFF39_06045 [Lawsonibacter sp.]|nr:hypothetical protein [Lawsonibacter sp.]